MSWALRRKAFYLSIVFIALLLLVGVPAYFYFHKTPTCFDNVQNGNEQGIDCGGSCTRVCSFAAVAPSVQWARIFPVAPGVYSAVAYVENLNFGVEAFNVPYDFKIRDEQNVLVYERKGTIYIPPKHAFPIFETGIVTGSRMPTKAQFEFTAQPDWKKSDAEAPVVYVNEKTLQNEATFPRLDATLENRLFTPLNHIVVTAILYGTSTNAIGVSQTVVDRMEGQSTAPVTFTWQKPFDEPVAKIDIIPLVVPVGN